MTKTRGWYASVSTVGALAVVAGVWLLITQWGGNAEQLSTVAPRTSTDDVQRLQQQIAVAAHDRALPPLQAQLLRDAANVLAAQSRQINTLALRIQALEVQRRSAITNMLATDQRAPRSASAPSQSNAAPGGNAPPGVNVAADHGKRERQLQRLIEAGASDTEARAMLAFVDELALQEVEARYRAYRTARNPRAQSQSQLREQMQALQRLADVPGQLQETFGDDAYDRYLYAIEQPNRVRVTDVLAGSTAQRAGLQPGDILVSYDGHPVHALDDLLRLAVEGNEGESVEVAATRHGEDIHLSVPRGPLGLHGESASIRPGH